MTKLHEKRLLKLADHLVNGKLGREKFDFTVFNNGIAFDKRSRCGTSGCAIGECPIIFRRHWKFDDRGFPVLKAGGSEICWHRPLEDAQDFFDLRIGEANSLFTPQDPFAANPPWSPSSRYARLGENATARQVAKAILRFVEWKKKATAHEEWEVESFYGR